MLFDSLQFDSMLMEASGLPWWKMSRKLQRSTKLLLQGSPFLKAPSSRSHYHPSQAQPLSQEQRHMALSPSRLQCRNLPASLQKAETPSPPHLSTLPDSSSQGAKAPNSDSTSPFNESWPSTERSSSSLTPEEIQAFPSVQASRAKAPASPKPQESVSDSESVIARYIERFRYGQPASRRERWAPDSHSSPFWWLGQAFAPEGTVSKKEAPFSSDGGHSEAKRLSLSPALDQSPSAGSQDISALDPDVMNLQGRAARLLHRSKSPPSSSRCVSSEGLSSSSTLTNADADLTGSISQHLAGHHRKGTLGTFPYPIAQMPHPRSTLKPEDDILFQWRLRRKMEEASKAVSVLPLVAWRSQCSQPTCAPSMMEGSALRLPEPTSWKSSDRVLPTSEAHPDVKPALSEHPCSCKGLERNGSSSKRPVEAPRISARSVAIGSPDLNGEQGWKEQTVQERPLPVCLDSPPPARPAGTSRPWHHAQRAGQPLDKVRAEPRQNPRLCQSERDRATATRGTEEPPASLVKHTVQHVLEEVVAERLFSPAGSPVPPKVKPKRSAKDRGLEEAVPEAAATPSHPQLLNMAAELLKQAEDSDGTEFEDDPLLQVLRGQRERLRSRLRAVDVRVALLESCPPDRDFSHR